MGSRHHALVNAALERALEIRAQAGGDDKSPICVFGLCERLGIKVRFLDVSMEGLYVRGGDGNAEIWVSSLRPLPRRVFTCAHELGHHLFGHGFSVDEMVERSTDDSGSFDPDEFLVDSFAGFLLMPTIGVRRAFAVRGWKHQSAPAEQLFTIACSFGVGYETLVSHMTYSLRMYTQPQRKVLLRDGPKTIRRKLLGTDTSDPLIVVDEHWVLPTIDAEVGTQVLLPVDAHVANDQLTFERLTGAGALYRATRPGISRITRDNSEWAAFVRISRYQFAGLSRYRHLEEDDDE